MPKPMSNLNIPGLFWVVILVLAGVLIQAYSEAIQAALHVPSTVVVAVVGVIFLVAKQLAGNALAQAIDLIERMLGSQQTQQIQEAPKDFRSSVEVRPKPTIVTPGEIPKRPNHLAWLMFG